jgi:thiamine biosynthesis lipoprotein
MGPASSTNLHHQEQVMGTIITIDLYNEAGIDPSSVRDRLRGATDSLHRDDRTFSTWKHESPVSRLRRGEISLGEAPLEVTEVLELCGVAKDLTHGWFDPWALEGGVDPTGYVKGWAARRALDHFRDADLDGAMVNAAGDIASFGGPVRGARFRIGIVQPSSPTELACVVETDGSIATSGAYERGDHLFNPFTGECETRVASASVSGSDLGLCDALATALVLGGDEVLEILRGVLGYEGFTIGHDGKRCSTEGFAFASMNP